MAWRKICNQNKNRYVDRNWKNVYSFNRRQKETLATMGLVSS
jgi:hypothetical protein